MHEQVIRCYAGLAGIREFSEAQLVCSVIHINVYINDSWALASKLHDAGDQIFSCSLSYNFTNDSASGETDHI